MGENKSSSPNPRNNLAWPVFFLMVLLLAAIGVAGYFGYQNNLLVKQAVAPSQKDPKQNSDIPTSTPTKTVTPSIKPTETGSITIDSAWNLYTNNILSFSIKVPKMSTGDAPCVLVNDSYRPAKGLVPVRVFEEPNGIYIGHEYRYDLTGETVNQGISSYSGCEKVANTLAYFQLKSSWPAWHIVSQKVANDTELETFIKTYLQSGCRLGEKKASSQEGIFDVSVLTDGKEPGESKCFLNYRYVLKYSAEKQRVWKWDMGQSFYFFSENPTTDYDSEMKNSFTVL